jgi:hypothetical protein
MVIRKCRFSRASILMNEMKEIADPSGANGSSGQVEQKWVIKCGFQVEHLVPMVIGRQVPREQVVQDASGSTEFPESGTSQV